MTRGCTVLRGRPMKQRSWTRFATSAPRRPHASTEIRRIFSCIKPCSPRRPQLAKPLQKYRAHGPFKARELFRARKSDDSCYTNHLMACMTWPPLHTTKTSCLFGEHGVFRVCRTNTNYHPGTLVEGSKHRIPLQSWLTWPAFTTSTA